MSADSRFPIPDSRSSLFGLAWRESRSTRRKLLLYMSSISLGVAALVAIDSFAGNITRSVREQSRALIGGDIVFSVRNGWTPASDSLLAEFAARGATITKQTAFASMAYARRTNATRLAQVRAVGEAYPLYGTITTRPPGQWERLPEGRNVLLDPALMIGLDAKVGDSISLGYQSFEIIGALDQVPGNPGIANAMAPRLFMSDRHMAGTGLLITGSRGDFDAYARYAGDPDALVKEKKAELDSAQVRARTIRQQETNITEGITELSNFLGLVGIIAVLLGGVGVASGVNAWVMRKIETVAILRCLGATTRQVMTIYITQAAVMGLLGATIGATLGVIIQFLLPGVLGDMLPVDVAVRLEPRAIAMGLLLGLWIAMAFALRPLLALRRVSPLQALRRSDDASPARRWWRDPARVGVSVLIAVSVIGLAATRAEDLKETFAFSGGIAAALVALTGSAAVLSFAARRGLRSGWPYVVRQGVANLYRPGNQTRSVVLSLGFGAFLVTTLYLVQSNLLATFRQAEFAARGNLIFFDIQEDQAAGIDSVVYAQGREYVARVPVVTARIAAINGRSVASILSDSTRRRQGTWAFRYEYRTTYRSDVTGTEKIVAGKWFGEQPTPPGGVPQVSMEVEVMSALGAELGDTITWNVQGLEVPTVVTSLREVNWERFDFNFFAVFEPAALARAPKTFAALVMAPDDSVVAALQRDIVRRYPNVASLDLSLVRRTINEISNRATTAIRFLAIFSLAMAVPVLFSAVSATRRDRVREGVLLKTLGATRRQITRIMFSEYALLGVLGSLAGMILSFGGAWLLLRHVFDRPFEPAFLEAGAIAGLLMALTVSIGLLAGRDVFKETPMAALRDT